MEKEIMNNVERFLSESKDIKEFAKSYFLYLTRLMERLDTEAITALVDDFNLARKQQSTIFLTGNGGSAATASHMANDIGLALIKKGVENPFRTLALTDNVSVMTAIGNDAGYENLFVQQLQNHYREGDRLVVISASGNSPNLVAAAEWVKAHGGKVIGLTGFDGGKLGELCDLSIHVKTPKGEYGAVEDIHMILDHLISSWLYHTAEETI